MSGAISNVQYGNPYAYAGTAEFTASLIAELPPGAAWNGPNLAALMGGVGAAFADLHAQAATLSEVETVPSLTTELLPFWEADYGLPDCCTPLGITIQQRRNTLLAKIAEIGGQNAGYFESVAAALGYPITVTPGAVGAYIWTANVPEAIDIEYFTLGASTLGDRLADWTGNTQLECVLNQIKPAYAELIFNYTG